MADIVFATSIIPDTAIIHDNDSFRVQWTAFNASNQTMPAFVDRLVIFSVPEGCPGSDDVEHDIVYDSDSDGDADDFSEPELSAGETGPLMQPSVGPFPAGSYRLTVTLASDNGRGMTSFNCVDVVKAT